MTFLTKVSEFIINDLKNDRSREELVVILPSQRSALIFKNILSSRLFDLTYPLPIIITTEHFFLRASGLRQLSEWEGTNLLLNVIIKYLPKMASDLLSVDYYLPRILNDFDEVHRSLANAELIFENLRSIKEIENWSLSQDPLTESQKEYLHFMNALGHIYKEYYGILYQKKQNFGSFHYRYVAENPNCIDHTYGNSFFYVVGLNALNACEEKIYYKLYSNQKLKFIFDADEGLLNDSVQEYGLFLRKHKIRLKEKKLRWEENYFSSEKKCIEIHEFRGLNEEADFGAFYIHQAVQNLSENERIGVIVANEKLWPVLLPKIADKFSLINISAEVPAHLLPGYSIVHSFFILLLREQEYFHLLNSYSEFTDICITFFTDPDIQTVLSSYYNINIDAEINSKVTNGNFFQNFLPNFMTDASLSPESTLNACIDFFRLLATVSNEPLRSALFLQVAQFCDELLFEWKNHPPIREDYSWLWLIKKISEQNVSIKSERESKIQVMGILESRCLDFSKVLVLGVQEGILPSGIRTDSFLPIDLKRHFKIPVYSDRDAVFAYHFFRLLHFPKKIDLSYHTGYYGENYSESRFVKQILMEWPSLGRNHHLKINRYMNEGIYFSKASREWDLSEDEKKKFLEWIEQSGISFSTLWDWRNCSLKHYFRKIAGIKPLEETDEMAKPAEFGDVLHKILKKIYTPLITNLSSINSLINEKYIKELVHEAFTEAFGTRSKNKNALILQLELAEKIIIKRWEIDKKEYNEGLLTKILWLEKNIETNENLNDIKIKFKGVIDRVDIFKENIRIIDYKTNVNAYDKFSLNTWDSDYWFNSSYHKITQLLFYSWLFKKNQNQNVELQSCILPLNFHHANAQYLTMENDYNIKDDILRAFKNDLMDFLKNYFSKPSVKRTDNKNACKYCDYRHFCYYD